MKYIFDTPETIKIDEVKTASFSGGMCPTSNEIYLFGRGDEDDWGDIISHEYLHSVLHRLNIATGLHHPIIDRVEKVQEGDDDE